MTGLIPPLYEALDTVSREMVGFIPAVQRDTGNFSRAAKGQVVTSFVTPAISGSDIVPGVTAPNDGDEVLSTVNMTIDKSRYWPIKWNGEEQMALNSGGAGPGVSPILVQQFQQAFRAGVNEVEASIASKIYASSSRAVGTPGTAPFGVAGDLSDFARTAQILDDNGAPMSNRHMVVGSAAMASLRGKQSVLFKANEAGTDALLRTGAVGNVEGFQVGFSPGVKAVVGGSGTGYSTAATSLVGQTAIPLTGGTGVVSPGDLISFAGGASTYVVNLVNGGTAPAVATSVTLSSPGLRVAFPAGTAATLVGAYTPNVAFTQDAIVLATRMPAVVQDYNGNAADMADDRQMITDPFSGITFEVSLYRQYRQIRIEVGLAWGSVIIKPEHIATLAG